LCHNIDGNMLGMAASGALPCLTDPGVLFSLRPTTFSACGCLSIASTAASLSAHDTPSIMNIHTVPTVNGFLTFFLTVAAAATVGTSPLSSSVGAFVLAVLSVSSTVAVTGTAETSPLSASVDAFVLAVLSVSLTKSVSAGVGHRSFHPSK
jgi:hypothetical protein